MLRFLFYFSIMLVVGGFGKLAAQTNIFRNITVSDGLANNFIKCIYKDYKGFIWIGSLEGLNRFDGTEIKSYSIEAGGIHESVNTIIQQDSSRLLIGTDAGLFELNLKTEVFRPLLIEKYPLKITVLAKGDSRAVLVGTDKGLFTYSGDAFKKVFFNESNSTFNFITGIVNLKDRDYWISTQGGLISIKKNAKPDYKYAGEQGFRCITILNNKLYLGGKNKGIQCFDLSTLTFSSIPEFNQDIVLSVSSNGENSIYAGTDGNGLKIFEPNTGKIKSIRGNENSPFSISSGSVYSFLNDNGVFWIGTYSGGVNYSINSRKLFDVKTFGSVFLTFNKSIRSFYFAPTGDVLIGGRNGFYFYEPNSRIVKEYIAGQSSNLRSNIILTIFPFNGNYLIGTYGGGVSLFNNKAKQFSNFIDKDDFKSGSVYQFVEDEAENLWMATLNGVYKYNMVSKNLEHYTVTDSNLPSNETYAINIDSKKRIWVGTMNGCCVLMPGETRFRRDFPDNFPNKFRTTAFFEDRSHNIWVSTEKGGIFKISPDLKHVGNLTVKDGLPDNAVCATIQDKKGDMWVSTLNGFCKISAATAKITSFEMSDGLPSMVFNPSAVSQLANGQLVWGNEKGMVSFFPDSVFKKSPDAPVRFTTFFLAGKEVKAGADSPLKNSVEESREIKLLHTQNSIGFRFVALNYLDEKDNRYLYKLEGLEDEWQTAGNRNTAFYNDLKPGKYIFKVKLLGGDDSKNVTQMRVTIQPSFFSTPYFYIILCLVLTGAGLVAYKWFQLFKNKLFQLTLAAQNRIQEKSKVQKINIIEGEEIKTALLNYMEVQKPYLNTNLKLTDVSGAIGYSVHEISHVLNQYMETNFSDFVNNYRVSECKARMLDEKHAKFTLIAIAEQCGFNSKASFYRAFKKVTNTTPAEYFKDYKNS